MATVKKAKEGYCTYLYNTCYCNCSRNCFGVVKSKSGEEVKLNTIATGDIYERYH